MLRYLLPWKLPLKMDPQNVDLKQTINLPKTAFSMKANLPQAEPKMLARWEEEKLYRQIRASRAGRPTYVLHDGPPYANGNIHLGTAFNKILKDFVVKSKTMAGFDSPYVPGWDCHGLPIEIKVDSELGSKKAQMSAVRDPRAPAASTREKYVDLQRAGFQAAGRVRPLGRSVPDDERAVPGRDRGRVRRFPGPGLRLQGTEAGQLVHQRPHRAGRSRSRVREPHQPVDLGSFRADVATRRRSIPRWRAATSTA